MNAAQQKHFDALYQEHINALIRQRQRNSRRDTASAGLTDSQATGYREISLPLP